MQYAKRLVSITILFCGMSFLAARAIAQTGEDAVYNSSGTNTPSPDFIDASMFVGTGQNQSTNICGVLYGILSGTFYSYPQSGAVIDARGISGTTALSCPSGTSPWWNGTTALTAPSTILLPAGVIGISYPWTLPPNTHLIGEGDTVPSAGTPGTTIRVTGGATIIMVQFGSSATCSGVSVERLTLDGQATAVDGIVNQYWGLAQPFAI